MDDLLPIVVGGFQLLLWGAGFVLLWPFVLSPAARARAREARMPAWDIGVSDFFLFLFFVMAGTVLAGIGGSYVADQFGLRGDAVTIAHGAAAQMGMLAGFLAFHARYIDKPSPAPSLLDPAAAAAARGPNIFVSGLVTFLVALPILVASIRLWETLLRLFGLPVDRQDLIGMFAQADSPWMIAIMVTLAIVVAPITEELVFRAGLYRYFRTRMPRWVALLVPAVFFAALHVDWHTYRGLASLAPLAVLAIVFSLAYERTGRIGTVIVAHALFNLNTILMILGGAALE